MTIRAGNVNKRLGGAPITSKIEVGTDLSYPNICLESSSQALRTSNLAPEAVHGLTDRCAVHCDHLNVIGMEDPSIAIKGMLINVSV